VRRRYDFESRINDRHDSDSEKEDEGPSKAAVKIEQEKMKDEMNKALGIKENLGKKSLMDEHIENKDQDEDSDDAEVIRKSEFVPTAGLTSVTQFRLEVSSEISRDCLERDEQRQRKENSRHC
jgi:hypothetical protein